MKSTSTFLWDFKWVQELPHLIKSIKYINAWLANGANYHLSSVNCVPYRPHYYSCRLGIKAKGWFIHEDYGRTRNKLNCNKNPLLLLYGHSLWLIQCVIPLIGSAPPTQSLLQWQRRNSTSLYNVSFIDLNV